MKQPISADEYFKENYKSSTINVVKLMESYSTYLLNFHLEQFAEEFKRNGKAYRSMMGMQMDRPHIDKLLYDYKLKNNIK